MMCSGLVLATTLRWWQDSCRPRPRSSAEAASRCLTWAAVLTILCAGALRSEIAPLHKQPAWQPCSLCMPCRGLTRGAENE